MTGTGPGWVAFVGVRRQRERVGVANGPPGLLLAERPGGPREVRGGTVLTVGKDGTRRAAARGGLACPGCGGRLGPWGHARPRGLRGAAGAASATPGAVRRLRVHACVAAGQCVGATGGQAVVIGAALVRAAAGWGHRRVAEWLGRSAATVRGWLRRFGPGLGRCGRRSPRCWCGGRRAGVAGCGRFGVADAVAAIVAAAGAVPPVGRAVLAVSPWLAAAVTSGRLLARSALWS